MTKEGGVSVGQRTHEIASNEAIDDVEEINGQQQTDQGAKEKSGLLTLLRSPEIDD